MEFANRSAHQVTPTPNRPVLNSADSDGPQTARSKRSGSTPTKGWRIVLVALLLSTTILIAAALILLGIGGTNEDHYLNNNAFQAVDINVAGASPTNQIYFGHLKSISNGYYVIDDVYYFPETSSSTSSTASATLEPLVCQVDAPYNQMIIDRANVIWWENLQSSGKVATTITQYEKANPKGPTCPTSSSSSSSSSSTSTTPTTTTTPPTKP